MRRGCQVKGWWVVAAVVVVVQRVEGLILGCLRRTIIPTSMQRKRMILRCCDRIVPLEAEISFLLFLSLSSLPFFVVVVCFFAVHTSILLFD